MCAKCVTSVDLGDVCVSEAFCSFFRSAGNHWFLSCDWSPMFNLFYYLIN